MAKITQKRSSPAAASFSSVHDKVADAVRRALRTHAAELVEAVRTGLETGGRSGRTYLGDGVVHQASAPGEPPASDTGELAASIEIDEGDRTTAASAKLGVYVTATADYAAPLELGTSITAPRPFLAPALRAAQPDAVVGIREAISAALAKRT